MEAERLTSSIDDQELLALLQKAYREVKRDSRELSLDNRLAEDLEIDSLEAIDILSVVEEATGKAIIDQLNLEFDRPVTVEDIVRELRKVL